MRTCAEVDSLLTPYADGELAAADRSAVSEHLAVCGPCRTQADAQGTARSVVRARAAALPAVPSPELRQRCLERMMTAQAVGRAAPAVPPARSWRRWVPMSVAASLVLALAGVLFYTLDTRLSAALLAELALDHTKCFALAGDRLQPSESAQVEQKFQRETGWHVAVPGGSPDQNLELLGAIRCHNHRGEMAHVLYRHEGRPVSLFVLPDGPSLRRVRRAIGLDAVVWSEHDRTYALLGPEPPEQLERLAAYVRVAVR